MTKSVLQDWVMALPLRAQGTILTAVRGCDLAVKPPTKEQLAQSVERHLSAWIRWCCLNPHDPREVDAEPGCWFRSTPPPNFRPSALDHYPQHWLGHVMHTLEVIAYGSHSSDEVAALAFTHYEKFAHGMHLNVETREQWLARMNEDRIANNTVVS